MRLAMAAVAAGGNPSQDHTSCTRLHHKCTFRTRRHMRAVVEELVELPACRHRLRMYAPLAPQRSLVVAAALVALQLVPASSRQSESW